MSEDEAHSIPRNVESPTQADTALISGPSSSQRPSGNKSMVKGGTKELDDWDREKVLVSDPWCRVCLLKSRQAVSSFFPDQGGSRYCSVNVAMIRWDQDRLGVAIELDKLQDVFRNSYGFNTERWMIPGNDDSHLNLTKKATDFLDDFDCEGNLFILYYAGHGFINEDRQSTWAWYAQPSQEACRANWRH
jgi:hypothetical protein